MARPTKFDKEKWLAVEPALLAAAKKGGSMAKLSRIADIPRPTLHRWEEDNPIVTDTLAKCKALAQEYFEENALKQIEGKQNGDGATLRFMMMNRFRNDYASERVESTVRQETKMSITDAREALANLDPDDIAMLLADLQAGQSDGK